MDNQYIDDATRRDLSRQDATATDTDFSLSLEEVAERYARAGHARTLRSLQRYCASGHLDARKIATTTGDKYLVTPQSVARHIAQIKECRSTRSRRDISRHVATGRDSCRTGNASSSADNFLSQRARHTPDLSRQGATESVPPVMETPVPPPSQRQEAATAHDTPRQGATEPAATGETSRYVAQLERQVEIARMNATSCASRSIAKTAPSMP